MGTREYVRAALSAAAVGLCAAHAAGSIIERDLSGTGSGTGLLTTAHVKIDIAGDGTTATFTVENTSPTASGPAGSPDPPSAGDAPILTIFGFQLDATEDDFTLMIDSPTGRFFDNSGANSSLGPAGMFDFRVDANNPPPGNGLAVNELLQFTLTAVGAFEFDESLFLDAPHNDEGFVMGARFQVIGPDGDDSSAAVPEPATMLVLCLGGVLAVLRTHRVAKPR
jgi:hypothetical protein